jgi:molybdopterin/thiamine biosynthesis adenylyltransferase
VTRKERLTEIILAADARAAPDVDLASRMPQFIGLADNPGPVLRGLRVAVIGVGSVGGRIALHLARAQVAELILCDRSCFKKESLLTQPMLPEAICELKAGYIGRLCKLISPGTRILVFDGPFEELDAVALAEVDVVFLATDNLAVEVAVGQACKNLGKVLNHASVHGETLVAQVRCFGNTHDDGPCPACGFGADEWRHLHEQTAFKCELTEDGRPVQEIKVQPTVSVSFLCSMAADLAVLQMFRQVLKLGQPVADTLLEYSGFTHRTAPSPLKRNPECPCDHQVWKRMQPPRPLAACGLAELADAAGIANPSFLVDELAFVETASCPCGAKVEVQQFAPVDGPIASCQRCWNGLYADTFKSHRPVAARIAADVLDRPLKDIGAAEARWVVVRNDDRAALFTGPSALAGEGQGGPPPPPPPPPSPVQGEGENGR